MVLALHACTYDNEQELFGTIETDPDPDTDPMEISLSNEVIPLMNTNCAISGCHVVGVQSPNLSVKANVISNASKIKSETQSGNMPRGRTITLAEKNIIKNWVDQGAKDN